MKPIDVTPKNSASPIFITPLTEQELKDINNIDQLESEKKEKDATLKSAIQKLSDLGLTEEEAKAIIGL
jgi:hypothetical protein